MSILRVGLRPSRNAKISFGVQLMLVTFWLIYGFMLAFSESPTNDSNFFHWVFIALGLVYLFYILAQNTSLFGTQSYLEITPGYLVEKHGHFRKKRVYSFQDMKEMKLSPFSVQLVCADGSTSQVDLKQIRKAKNLIRTKEQLKNMALKYNIPISESHRLPHHE